MERVVDRCSQLSVSGREQTRVVGVRGVGHDRVSELVQVRGFRFARSGSAKGGVERSRRGAVHRAAHLRLDGAREMAKFGREEGEPSEAPERERAARATAFAPFARRER